MADCIMQCPQNDPNCAQQCFDNGTPTAQQLASAWVTCSNNSGCQDSACFQQKCGAQIQACLSDTGSGSAPSAPQTGNAPAPTSGCGNITGQGVCEGNTLKYCAQNQTVQVIDCAAGGATCGFDNAQNDYDCLGGSNG